MNSFDLRYTNYGWDTKTNCPFGYSVSPLSEQDRYENQELNIDVQYKFLQSVRERPILESEPDISHWEIRIIGRPTNNLREELVRRLTAEQVPSGIKNEVIQAICNSVIGCEVVGVRVMVTVFIFDCESDEETGDELDMGAESSIEE